MQIIPVIDLKGGVVVHGIAGQRQSYAPVESQLGCDASPLSVAAALRDHTGCETMYVADLDALAGEAPDESLRELIILDKAISPLRLNRGLDRCVVA